MAVEGRIRAPRLDAAPTADSRLRSVFLQHRLLRDWRRIPGVGDPLAHAIVAAVVDRLLATPGGLEPLVALEQGGRDLGDEAVTAVLAVVLARAAGWPEAALADLGVAAFVARIGSALDADDGPRAGMRWLLERGVDDVWLRCAEAARLAPAADQAAVTGAPAVVRLALAAHAAIERNGWRDGWQRDRALQATGAPAELAAVLPAAFGAG